MARFPRIVAVGGMTITLFFMATPHTYGARSEKFSGRVFAYYPWSNLVMLSSVPTCEQILMRLDHPKRGNEFVKLDVCKWHAEPLDNKYLLRGERITLRAVRTPTCDEMAPKLLTGVPDIGVTADAKDRQNHDDTEHPKWEKFETPEGYRITEPFMSEPIPQLKNVECYHVSIPTQ
jgi:hypothetical protein